MKMCRDCKDDACINVGNDCGSCDDFTGTATEEELAECQFTVADYVGLSGQYDEAQEEIARLEVRLADFENAVAALVRWAQGNEAP